jgi:hypothetical protein
MKTQDFLNQLKWILLAGGSLFFFIRAIGLAVTGGDCFGTINPVFSWFLLLLEIMVSGTAATAGILGLVQWIRYKRQNSKFTNKALQKVILFAGIIAYTTHLIRVAIWIILCVI